MYAQKRYTSKGLQFSARYQDRQVLIGTNISNAENQDVAEIAPNHQSNLVPTTHGSYAALILHPKWKARRSEILERDHHRCAVCKGDKELQIHHRQYHFVTSTNQFKVPWDYPDRLLLTLCEKCHSRGHSKFKVPIIKI